MNGRAAELVPLSFVTTIVYDPAGRPLLGTLTVIEVLFP